VDNFRSFVSAPKDVFGYFDTQLDHPTWTGRHVLDFGGNVGNLLVDAPIEHERYWCVDVSAVPRCADPRACRAAHPPATLCRVGGDLTGPQPSP
jgi:hypothetical protein